MVPQYSMAANRTSMRGVVSRISKIRIMMFPNLGLYEPRKTGDYCMGFWTCQIKNLISCTLCANFRYIEGPKRVSTHEPENTRKKAIVFSRIKAPNMPNHFHEKLIDLLKTDPRFVDAKANWSKQR